MPTFTVREIAALVGGEPVGDLDRIVRSVKPILEAGADDVTFIANPR